MFCDENNTKEICKNYNTLWSSSNAIIKNFKVLDKKIGIDKETKLNYCEIYITATLTISKGKSDPNFDFFSKLNKRLFSSGDRLNIFVETKVPMYLNIFQWQLNSSNVFDAEVIKIFPNKYDDKNFIVNKVNIPNNLEEEIKEYDLIISFGDSNNKSDTKAEYILILGTKNNINFRSNYLLGHLKSIINEIDLSDRRERTHTYKILYDKE